MMTRVRRKRAASSQSRTKPERTGKETPWIVVFKLAGGSAFFHATCDTRVDAETLAIALKAGVAATLIDCYDPHGECFRSLLG